MYLSYALYAPRGYLEQRDGMVEEVVEEGEALVHHFVVQAVGGVFPLIGEHCDAGCEEAHGDAGVVEDLLVPHPVQEHIGE